MGGRSRAFVVAAATLVVLGAAFLASLLVGAAEIPPRRVAEILLGIDAPPTSGPAASELQDGSPDAARTRAGAPSLDPSLEESILLQLRLPRALVGLLVGAALAVAGVLLQGLFRNALAAPGVVGTSAGGALGAVCALSLGLGLRSLYYVPLGAILGSFGALLLVARIARHRGRTSVTDLLLAGVALNAFLSAANSFLIARSWVDHEVARRINFWLMGGIADRNWTHVAIVLPGCLIGLLVAVYYARDLDLILQGEDVASSLGVNNERLKLILLLATALLVGSAVAVSGVVGFVGLVVPHLVRLLVGPSHRQLVILSALVGSAFLLSSDLVARLAVAPGELQLGIVTAFVGAPFFVFLLIRERQRVDV
jgi:iron complex transport system permease protein